MVDTRKNYNAVIAIIVTLICPPIGLCISLLALYKDFENWRSYILCIAWSMAVFAYCYEPTTSSDLVSYYDYLNLLKGTNFKQALNLGQYGKDGLYSFVFVSWIVTKLGDIRLLPAISTFSVYILGLFVTCQIGEEDDLNNKTVFQYILIVLLSVSFYSIVNNVRNIWAFSMIGFAVFRDVYQKKRNLLTGFFYLFPVFMHSSAMVFIIVRLIMVAPKKIKLSCTALCFLIPMLLNILSSRFSGLTTSNIFLSMLLNMVNTGNNYFEHTTSSWALTIQNSGSAKLERVIYMMIALIIFCLYIDILRKKTADCKFFSNKRVIQFMDFPFLSCLLTFACSTMVMPEYWRFVTIAILFGGVVFIASANLDYSFLFKRLIQILTVITFILWIRNLCLYSDVSTMLFRSFVANPIAVFILNTIGCGVDIIQF